MADAHSPADMDLPGLRLPPVDRQSPGDLGCPVTWRLTFRFEDGEAVDIDLEDYH